MYKKYEYSGAILLKNHNIHALDLLSLKKKTDPGGHTGGTGFKLEYLNKFELIFETALGETYLIKKNPEENSSLYFPFKNGAFQQIESLAYWSPCIMSWTAADKVSHCKLVPCKARNSQYIFDVPTCSVLYLPYFRLTCLQYICLICLQFCIRTVTCEYWSIDSYNASCWMFNSTTIW